MERLAILVGLATAVETVAASGSEGLIPRWTGGYRQADWMESSIPFLELALLFAVVVYVFETYLDVRQYSRIKQRGGVVPPELRTLLEEIDRSNAEAKAAAPPAPAIEKEEPKEGEEKPTEESEEEEVSMLAKMEGQAVKAQGYGLAKMGFGFVMGAFSQVEDAAMILSGFMPWSWDYASALVERLGWTAAERPIAVSLAFLAIQLLSTTVLHLPFDYYFTFVIEQKYGFNKQTLFLFLKDKVMTLALSAVFGGPIVAGLLSVIKWGGERFYLYVWAFSCAVSLFMMTIYPIWIQPLFNKLDPLPTGVLREAIEELARSVKYPLVALFVIDGSKRSGHSNAYMYGFGKNKRIVLFDTLLKQVKTHEIVAILGHELGHWFFGHVLQGLVITQLYLLATFVSFSFVVGNEGLYSSYGFAAQPTLIGLLLFSQTVWAPVDKLLNFLMTLNVRKNEFQADRYATGLGYADGLQRGLIKITSENLGTLDPDPLYSVYHYSHPPLVQRLRAIQAAAKDHAGVQKKSN